MLDMMRLMVDILESIQSSSQAAVTAQDDIYCSHMALAHVDSSTDAE